MGRVCETVPCFDCGSDNGNISKRPPAADVVKAAISVTVCDGCPSRSEGSVHTTVGGFVQVLGFIGVKLRRRLYSRQAVRKTIRGRFWRTLAGEVALAGVSGPRIHRPYTVQRRAKHQLPVPYGATERKSLPQIPGPAPAPSLSIVCPSTPTDAYVLDGAEAAATSVPSPTERARAPAISRHSPTRPDVAGAVRLPFSAPPTKNRACQRQL
ncbi:hypothetical protein HMN09_00542900 [Mycena chlorophos]|uniref:Uncharacterized protein n=1 Tax=Mycena chlorophos TaxID=658473 RepID=A0A8H6WIT6_MYCCL|nr:hypothetical protein HMN09_00542900 [Mycena chlorophos]